MLLYISNNFFYDYTWKDFKKEMLTLRRNQFIFWLFSACSAHISGQSYHFIAFLRTSKMQFTNNKLKYRYYNYILLYLACTQQKREGVRPIG